MPQPLAVLLDSLVQSRRGGLPFEAAWPEAVGEALGGVRGVDLAEWQSALSGTRTAWQASYNHWTQRHRERALMAVAVDPERVPVEGLSDCPVCRQPVPLGGRGRRRVYCSAVCQRAAHGRIVPAAA